MFKKTKSSDCLIFCFGSDVFSCNFNESHQCWHSFIETWFRCMALIIYRFIRCKNEGHCNSTPLMNLFSIPFQLRADDLLHQACSKWCKLPACLQFGEKLIFIGPTAQPHFFKILFFRRAFPRIPLLQGFYYGISEGMVTILVLVNFEKTLWLSTQEADVQLYGRCGGSQPSFLRCLWWCAAFTSGQRYRAVVPAGTFRWSNVHGRRDESRHWNVPCFTGKSWRLPPQKTQGSKESIDRKGTG